MSPRERAMREMREAAGLVRVDFDPTLGREAAIAEAQTLALIAVAECLYTIASNTGAL